MSKDITTKFKVDISDLKKNISAANQQIKQAEAEFRNATVGMDNWAQSADGLSAAIDAQTKKVSAEEDKLAALKQEMQRYTEKAAQGEAVIADLTRKHQEAADAFGEDSAEAKKYARELAEAQSAQERNAAAADRLRTDIVNQDTAVKNAKNQLDGYRSQLADVENQTQKTSSSGLSALGVALGNLAADAIAKCVDGLKQFITQTIEVGKGFEGTMSQVKAISGASAEDMEALTETASELGRTTSKSAQEVAEGFSYMAMAGWKTEDMLGGINGIVKLSEASQTDLATASDIVTDALTAFGESADQAGRLADIMAAASSNANTNVEMMGETFKFVAPLAGAMGYSMEDMSTAVGLMANSGIKATQAGTSLRGLLTRMASPTKESAIAMRELGISLADDEGHMYSFEEVMRQIRAGFGDIKMPIEDFNAEMSNLQSQLESGELSEDDFNKAQTELTEKAFGAEGAMKAQYASMLAGKNGLSGLLAIVNASEEDFDKLSTAINNSEGAASRMASTMIDNLGGDITLLQSAFEAFQMSIYNNVSGPLRELVQGITNDVMPALEGIIAGTAGAGEALGSALGGLITKALSFITDGLPEVVSVGVSLVSALATGLLDAAPDLITAGSECIDVILRSLGKLMPTLADKIIAVVPEIAERLSDSAGYILAAGISLLESLAAAVPKIVPKIAKALPKIIDSIVKTLNKSIPLIMSAALDLLNALVSAVPRIIPPLVAALPEIIDSIVSVLGENVPVLLEGAVKLLMAIIDAIPIIAEALIPQIPIIVQTIVDTLIENYPKVVESVTNFIEGLVETVPAVLEQLWAAILSTVDTFLTDLWAPLVAFVEPFTQLWFTGWETIAGGAKKAWETIKTVWSAATGFFKKIWTNIKTTFSAAPQVLKATFASAWDGVKAVWSGVTGYFKGIWDGIKTTFSVAKDTFSGFFTGAWNAVTAVFDKASGYFSGIWASIKKPFATVSSFFSEKFSSAWGNVTAAFSSVKTFFTGKKDAIVEAFKNIPSALRETFSGAWDKIKGVFSLDNVKNHFNAIKDAIKSVFDAMVDVIKSPINTVIDGINSVFDTLNSVSITIPHVFDDGETTYGFNMPHINRLAKGAIIDKATIAEIGEAGREAVIPLENNKAGLREIARLLREEMPSKPTAPEGYTFNQTINSPKPLNRYELYRQTKNLIKAAKLGAI
ncbi:MAG: phage tail tape measure protein [Ruminococcus sp.]|nr:phage tail tape measure protein [Ruminococcus sp.]